MRGRVRKSPGAKNLLRSRDTLTAKGCHSTLPFVPSVKPCFGACSMLLCAAVDLIARKVERKMGKGKNVTVTQESDTGRNEQFWDTSTGKNMTRGEFVRQIEQGKFPDYHIRKIDGVKTPVSNPDNKESNNLD